MPTTTIAEDIELLSHRLSDKRRSGARRLRKRGDPAAGPPLLAALQEELEDTRTWETQYHMIMVLGYCNYRPALPLLQSLPFLGGMPDLAVGDATLRLSREHDHDARPILKMFGVANQHVICGAMEAIAILRMVPDEATMQRLIDFGLSMELGQDDSTVVWLLRTVPGWPERLIAPLLDKWSAVTYLQNQQILNAVELARKRKYDKWSPL